MSTTYFSEREQGPRPRTDELISQTVWRALLRRIEVGIGNGAFGWRFPAQCDDGYGPCGTDEQAFWDTAMAEVPDLPIPDDSLPGRALRSAEDVDTVIVLDLLEFCARSVTRPIKAGCRVGGGAPRGRWPPSAAQTVRAVFPHTAFTKTSSRDEDRWRNQRVEPSSGPSGSASRQVSSVADVGVFHSWNCPPQRPCSSHRPVWSRPSSPAAFPNPLGCRPLTVTRLSPRFRYYSAVRLLDEHPFPLRSRL